MSTGVEITRLDRLTSLRFFAALLVVVHHTARYGDLGKISEITEAGTIGVGFFFALSGFILTWTARPGSPGSFYRRRFARVFPLHALTWLAALALISTGRIEHSLLAAATGLVLLQAWVPDNQVFYGMNAPSWSLSCEAFFYAVFPFLPLARARKWHLPALAIAPLAAAIALTATIGYSEWLTYNLPPFRFLGFLAGVVLAVLMRRGLRVRVPMAGALLIVGAGLLFTVGPLQTVSRLNHGIDDGVMLPFWLLLIAAAATSDLQNRPGLLTSRPLIRLGEWSFALYLTHWLLLQAVDAWGPDPSAFTFAQALLADAVVVCIAIGLSACAYYAVERPLERALRGAAPRPEMDAAKA